MGGFTEAVIESTGASIGAPCYVRGEFYSPPEQFDGCFTSFYRLSLDVRNDGTVVDYLQPEWANIRFFAGSQPNARLGQSQVSGSNFAATGPSSLACRFELGTARMWGIGFLPLGWARFIEANAYELANIACDGATHPAFAKFNILSEALSDVSMSEQEQLDFIAEKLTSLMRPSRDEAKILRVHEAIVDNECATVSGLADHCAMSVRTLERVCRRYFGFTPKLLLRRQRFMRSLSSFMLNQVEGGQGRWTDAMDTDYHDQAQFTREFREFMTMLPSDYAAVEHPILSAFMEARARVWGSAVQTLDVPGDTAVNEPGSI